MKNNVEDPKNKSPSTKEKTAGTTKKKATKKKKATPPQKKGKKPTVLEEKILPNIDKIRAWRREGLTEKQISQSLNIAYSTLSKYKLSCTELAEVLKEGKEELVVKLEDSLYKVALGTTIVEEKTITTTREYKDGTSVTNTETTKFVKQLAPNVVALIFALKNLVPQKWRDNPEVEKETDEGKALAEALVDLAKDKMAERDRLRKQYEEEGKQG